MGLTDSASSDTSKVTVGHCQAIKHVETTPIDECNNCKLEEYRITFTSTVDLRTIFNSVLL